MAQIQKIISNYLFCMLSIFVIASIFFLNGFFPISSNVILESMDKKHYDNIQKVKLDEYILKPPSAKYDQIILMIIDAWRADYPNATNMPFTYQEACINLNLKVDIPTVTMPRIKSMTTGSISNFIDIVLNLGHTSKLDDSILHRLSKKNKSAVFAGDRTWKQLFPTEFKRTYENIDSFFVNDFYEGDTNVTHALKNELKLTDWNIMILHYLGLDHIGHVEGSHSDRIYTKLLEMDNVVKYISRNDIFKNSLLLITGDHGMRNGGNHGGCDKEELHVPLLGFHKNCISQERSSAEYNQIDITATLAVLLDVEIPHTSIGCLVSELLDIYSREDQLYFYYYNVLHLMEKFKTRFNLADLQFQDYFSWYTDAKMSHKEFISSKTTSVLSYENARKNYIRLSKAISQTLSESLVQYDMTIIIVALTLSTLCVLKLIINIFFEDFPTILEIKQFLWKSYLMCLTVAITIIVFAHFFAVLKQYDIISSILFTLSISLSLYIVIDISKTVFTLMGNRNVKFRLKMPLTVFFLYLCQTLSLASSSFIEEEHQTWYYFTPTLLVYLTFQNFYNNVKIVWQKQNSIKIIFNECWKMRFVVILMSSIIICRRLNQTGDKWRHLLDIGDVLIRSENYAYLTLALITGQLFLLSLLQKYNSLPDMILCFVALFCVFLYRQIKQYKFIVLIIFWSSVIIILLRNYFAIFSKFRKYGYQMKENLVYLLKTNLTCCLLISALLHKPHNVILLPSQLYILEKSYHLCDNLYSKDKRQYNRCYVLVLKTMVTIFIGNMFYFYQGNSNSLTTIDLNPGYIGLSSYNSFVVGFFITLNTFCAPINAFLYLMWHMIATQKNTLPFHREKDENNILLCLFESTKDDLILVYSIYTIATVMPIGVYWCLLVGFRYHLFIYSVFAPKALYQCFYLLVFYTNFIITNLFFMCFF